MNNPHQNLENSLMSHDFEGQSKARNMHRRRLALGRALTSEKYANKLLRQQIQHVNTHLTSLEKKRRQSLLIGIRFKQLLENVTTARSVSEILQQQQIKKTKKQEQESFRRKQQYLTRRNNVAELKEVSKLIFAEKLQKIKNTKRKDSLSLSEDIQRITMNTRQNNRQKYQRIKSEHHRLRQKMRKIQQFKQARAQKNYLSKLEEITQRQTIKSNTLRDLKNKQHQLQSTFASPQRGNQTMLSSNLDFGKLMFTTDVVFQKGN